MRKFDTGATRDDDTDKPDYIGYLSPDVLKRYAAYMLKHQVQADGQRRASDNWKKGMGKAVFIRSAFRHVMDWWTEHEGKGSRDGLEEAICALLFNAMGYLHEHLQEQELKRAEAQKAALLRAQGQQNALYYQYLPYVGGLGELFR